MERPKFNADGTKRYYANHFMIPEWLPFEKHQEFLQRIDAGIERARQRYGREPGYRLRQCILTGVMFAFRNNIVGNSKWGSSMLHKRAIKINWDRIRERDGDCIEESKRRFRGPGKKGRAIQAELEARRANRAVQDKRSFLEF